MKRAALLFLGLLACSGDVTLLVPDASELAAAPTTVTFDGTSYRLDAYVGRDEMPSLGTDNTPLIAELRLFTVDGSDIPGACDTATSCQWQVQMVAGFVEYTGAVWSSDDLRGPFGADSAPTSELTFVMMDGPDWPSGDEANVVVRIRSNNGQESLLRAERVPVY